MISASVGPAPDDPPGVVSGQGCSGARVLQTFVAANICSHLASTKEPPSTRGIPAPDCSRANNRDACEVPSVWCGLRERSRFFLFFAPLVLTCNAQPLRCFGTKHISAKGHPTGSSLLQKVRAWRAVEDQDNLIGAAPRASSGSVHSLPLIIKEPESLKARTPTPGGAKCGLARTGGGLLQMPARFRLRP